MRRRILVALIALVSTFSIVYAMESSFHAAVASNSGGNVTGRIGMAPSGITGSSTSLGFKKGDKISMNANDWILIRKDNYTDYGCTTDTACAPKTAKNAWLSLTMNPTESANFVPAVAGHPSWSLSPDGWFWFLPYSGSETYQRMKGFNTRITSTNNQKIIAPKNLTYIHFMYANRWRITGANAWTLDAMDYEWDVNSRSEFGSSAFILTANEYLDYLYPKPIASHFAIPAKDFVYNYSFGVPYFQYDPSTKAVTTTIIFDKTRVLDSAFFGVTDITTPTNIRAGVYLDLENVVFAASNGTANGMGTVTMPDLPTNYSVLVDSMAPYKAMKARVRDTSLNVALDSVTYNGANANKVVVGTPFDITYSGGTVGAGNTVSVILLNSNNEFKYYQQLETTKATGTVNGISTTNMPLGKYKVYLVNEVVTGNNDATTSSSMVGGYEIEVVAELVTSYSPTSAGYSYKRNVNSNDVVGNYSLTGGSNPVTYTIKDDTAVSGRVNEGYKNFVFNNNTSSSTGNTPISNEVVKINSVGPNIHDSSLKPGKYCFVLEAKDSSGDSTKGTKSTSVCVDVDPSLQTIAFSTSGTRFEKLINGSATITDELATSSGVGNGAITYAITGSTPIGIATINTSTGEIAATGAGTITVTATRTDPDGNYATATATKTIKFYDGIAGTFTQKITPLHQGDANALANSSNVIANVSNVTGGMGTIKYISFSASLGGNDVSSHFRMAANGNFTPILNLSHGTYDFSVTLEDDNGISGQTVVKGQLIVSLEKNTAFKITATNNLITESLSDAQSNQIQLVTTGKKGNGTIHYELAKSSKMDPNETIEAISVSDGGLIQANRAMSTNDVYKVYAYIDEDKANGLAKQITQEVEIKITKIPQSIAFDASVPSKVRFEVDKTFNILAKTTRNDNTTGTITYKSSTPTICSVDDPSLPTAKMLTKGTCSITAENKDANYVEAIQPKEINLYEGISGTFTQSIKPLNQGDATATAGSTTTIARVGALSGGDGTYTYVSVKAMLGSVDMSSYFKIDASGNITPVKNLKYGEYDMTVTMRDGNGAIGEVEIIGTLSVGLESNTAFKLTYDGSVVTTITQDYSSAIATPIRVDTQTKKGTSAVKFELTSDSAQDPNESGPALEIDSGTGIITVHRAMSPDDVYKVFAYIPEDKGAGLAKQITQEVEIKITKIPQTIVFDVSVPNKVRFEVNKTFTILATTVRTDSTTGTITYKSSTPTICSVDDPSLPTAKMLTKGTCSITAENKDASYVGVTEQKSIELYEGISGTFTQSIKPLNQGDAAATAGSTTTIARVGALSGGDGTYTYVSVKAMLGSVDMSSYFKIDASGNITPVKDLKYGEYDMTVTMRDGNGAIGEVEIKGTLSVGLESNKAFKLTYDDSVATTITQDYSSAKAIPIIVSTQMKKGTSAVQFELTSDSVQDPNESGSALEIDIDTGIITVNRAMSPDDVYKVYAYIPEDKSAGLAKQITQEVEIRITNSPQSIAFLASDPTQVKFVSGDTFQAGASITRVDGTTGLLRYTSMTLAICTVNDSATPTVTMVSKGTCIVKAENRDKNYVNASLSKSIPLYDGLSADYLQAISPLRQGDDDALANSGVTIAKIINLAGDQGTVSYTHLVELNGVDVSEKFQISQTGELTPLADIKYGTYDVTITLQDTTGVAGQAVVTGKLDVDLEVNDEFFITYKGSKTNSISEGFTTASKGMSVGTTGKKAGQVKFSLIAVKDPNETLEVLSVSDAGVVSVNRVSTPQDSYKVYASIAQDTTQGLEEQVTPEVPIVITNAQMGSMQYMVDGTINTMIQKTYEASGVIELDIDGKPAGGSVEYELIMDASGMNNGVKVDDVVSLEVDENGKTTGKLNILNASLTSQINQVQIQATVKSSGYADTTLPPISVLIDKAEQTQFKFAQPVYQMPNGSGSFTPVLSGGALHDDGITLNYRLDCTDPYDVSVDPDSPTTFLYDVSDEEGASIVIKARNNGNRNYNMKEVSATLQILKPGISLFDVNVRPGRVITYGNHVTLEPVLVDGESATFTYTSLDTSVLRQDTVTDNVFISENIGTAQIKVIKKESGKTDAEVLVTIKVNPKPVQVELDQVYSIKVGEEIPTFVLKPFETGIIINNDPLPEPVISTSATDSKTPGTYPITITYPSDPIANRYKFTQVPSDLIIEQDSGQASWMVVYPDGTTPPPLTSSDLSKWYASDMVVELVANGDGYDEVSENQMTWNNSYLLSNEGENTSNVYFKKSSTGALSSPITTTVKIDKTEPNITSITGENFNISPLAYLMNVITLDNFFKPGTQIEIKTEDININESISTSGVEKVHYKVYEIDEDNVVGDIVEENDVAVNTNGIASFKMNHIGQYRVCAVASDYAGNISTEGCADIMVKKIDVNVDEDEGLDFNDPDGDGCPDLNIKWIKPNKDWVKLNIDKDKDGIPELNIDSDGDGLADINVDTDKDGKPDLNIVQLKEWNPAFCVTNQQELYCTMKDIKPLINVDIAGISKDSPKDNIPDLNIDTDGDMKANINISKDGKTASVNIAKVHKWEPSKDYKFETFMYDSIGKEEVKVELNYDTDNDGRPDINLDPKGTGKPTLNIDIDGDGIPDVDIDTDGDGKPDINIDKDGNGIADVNTIKLTEWKPEKNVDEIEGFPYDTMEGLKGKDILEDEDSGIQIEKPGGSFLPNYSIKVDDIKDSASDELKSELDKFIEDETEVKDIYDVKMSDGITTVQPDGSVKVRIPLKSDLNDSDSVKVIVEQKDGTYKEVSAVVKDGYIEYETDFLGKVGIIADKAMSEPEPEPDPEPEPELRPDIPIPDLKPNGATGGSTPETSVKGSYTQGSGGASTGDSTSIEILFGVSVLAMFTMYISIHTKKKKKKR